MHSSQRASASQRPRNFLLRSLPASEWAVLQGHCRNVSLNPTLLHLPAGERLTGVYFPESGLVSLVVTMATGATAAVAVVGVEGMLGISVALDTDASPFEMVSQIPGRALWMEARSFQACFKQLPEFRQTVLRYSYALLSHTSRTAACNALHPVGQRLARSLLLCRDRVGSDTFPLTHEAVAHMLGVGRPFVTHTMGLLHEEGLIEYRRGKVRILDSCGLEAAACEDYQATEAHYIQSPGGWPGGRQPSV